MSRHGSWDDYRVEREEKNEIGGDVGETVVKHRRNRRAGEWGGGLEDRKECRDRKQQHRKDQTFSVAAENRRKDQQRCCCCCCCCQGHFTETPLHSSGYCRVRLTRSWHHRPGLGPSMLVAEQAGGGVTFNWRTLADVLAATQLGPNPAVPTTLRENRSWHEGSWNNCYYHDYYYWKIRPLLRFEHGSNHCNFFYCFFYFIHRVEQQVFKYLRHLWSSFYSTPQGFSHFSLFCYSQM